MVILDDVSTGSIDSSLIGVKLLLQSSSFLLAVFSISIVWWGVIFKFYI